MWVSPEQLERIIDALARLYKILGVKSSASRVMLGVEVFLGIFLLLILLLIFADTIYESIYAALRGLEYAFHSSKYYSIAISIMAVSVVIVLIRELQE